MIQIKNNKSIHRSSKLFSEDYSALAESIKKELPALERYIEKKFKLKCKLECSYDRAKGKMYIWSKSLMNEATSDIDKLLFKDIQLNLWGGDLKTSNNTTFIWFNIHFSYEHVTGGENGHELPDGQVYYDVQDHEWLSRTEADARFRRKL